MNFKLIMAVVNEEKTQAIVDAARAGGATGATVITNCRGEGLTPEKTFLGLDLTAARDVVLFLVAEPRAREILETIAAAGRFDDEPGSGIALQIAIEDAVGLKSQLPTLKHEIEDEL
ncbi:MAG TPA: P-II family nitrogen regulator [Kiloniellales bacterium]|jgi:nitrogen regulatory protein PII